MARGRGPLRWGILLPGAVLCLIFLGLGIWQVQRLEWKRDLIARTEAAVTAAPVPAPGPGAADQISEYRRVSVNGRYLSSEDTLVRAVTAFGAGYWVMTPFRTEQGWQLLVNRGFVAVDQISAYDPAATDQDRTLTGLMRATQTDGAFLRSNDPGADRWFSRDVQAIADARGVGQVAPWFLDLDRMPDVAAPIGGLTVVSFPNSHLTYALTWFAMAAGLGFVLVFIHRHKDEPEA